MSWLRGKRALHARTVSWYMNSLSKQKRNELYRDAGLPGAMRGHRLGERLRMNIKEKPERGSLVRFTGKPLVCTARQ